MGFQDGCLWGGWCWAGGDGGNTCSDAGTAGKVLEAELRWAQREAGGMVMP